MLYSERPLLLFPSHRSTRTSDQLAAYIRYHLRATRGSYQYHPRASAQPPRLSDVAWLVSPLASHSTSPLYDWTTAAQPLVTAAHAMSTTTPARRSARTAATTAASPITPSSGHGMTTRSASRLRDAPPPTKPTPQHDDDADDDEDDDDEDEEDEEGSTSLDNSGVDSDTSITGSSNDVETAVEKRLGVVSISVAAIVFSLGIFALLAVAYNVRALARKSM